MAVLGGHPEVGRHNGGLTNVLAVVNWIDPSRDAVNIVQSL